MKIRGAARCGKCGKPTIQNLPHYHPAPFRGWVVRQGSREEKNRVRHMSITSRSISINDGTVQVRRMSWREFYQLRPDLRPDNDNERRCAAGKSEVVRPAE